MADPIWGPTYEEMLSPGTMDPDLRRRALAAPATDPLDPVNLYNITWKRPDGTADHLILPRELTGVEANIVCLLGRGLPTGSHKVGATYAVTMEEQLSGRIRPGRDTLIYPSTGNYGIGGAWAGGRMGYRTVVVLPEQMSRERFDMLERLGADIVRTPGGEANVSLIYRKCRELEERPHTRVLNQFEVWANYRFHYHVTGNTVAELLAALQSQGVGDGRCAALVSAIGSGGTIAAGDRLKQLFPGTRIVGLEPIQCPTLYMNGYGDHQVQGIGDRHVTWIHNALNMDAVVCVDDADCLLGLQLLTDPRGLDYLAARAGVPEHALRELARSVGISGVANILGAIKAARFWRLSDTACVVTVLTDTIDRYGSVMQEVEGRHGPLDAEAAAARYHRIFQGVRADYVQEGTDINRQRWFNLKYFTWVEQQGRSEKELDAQRSPAFWQEQQAMVAEIDDRLRRVRGL